MRVPRHVILLVLVSVVLFIAACHRPCHAGEGLPGGFNARVEMGIIGTNTELEDLIRAKLEAYPHVIVKARDGIVTLSGAVFNEKKRGQVLEIVRSTGGVEGVDDEMRVRH